MKIERNDFGVVNGQPVDLFVLANDAGMVVKITNYGAIITSVNVPDSTGKLADVVCGFDTLDGYFSEEYRSNAPYFGCIVGRYAGRIEQGQFALGDQEFQLAKNDAANSLHGGTVGFDKKVWAAQEVTDEDSVGLNLTLVSEDGEEGYPGEICIEVQYRLTRDNAILIRYIATTNKATPLSLTNHSYFNLNGFSSPILDHRLAISSNSFLLIDDDNVPRGEQTRVDGADDFTNMKPIREAFEVLPQGFEHYYLFDKPRATKQEVAVVEEPQSGRTLRVITTEPGMLFYTGFYTSDTLQRESGASFGQFRAMCFETSKYPNGPNIPGSPDSILHPGERYFEETEFHFGW
ncbi:MAG: aldose epimerase family protein [Pseudomonadales bacterium]